MTEKIPARGWYLEHRDGGHFKFYTVIATDNGVVVNHWGRIGTRGQFKIEQQSGKSSAIGVAERKVYDKAGKGYEMVHEAVVFQLDERDIEGALGVGRVNADPARLTLLFDKVLRSPQFTGEKDGVLGNYEVFIKKAEAVMSAAQSPTTTFDRVMSDYDELEQAWKEIEDRHSLAETTVSFAKQLVAQAMLSGKL